MKRTDTAPPAQERFSLQDSLFMRRAISLARRGEGKTSPNPLVGALLVKGGVILGEGWHRRFGALHAEAEAVRAALSKGHSLTGASLYCTLEPCCFTSPEKHQPPCTDLIVQSGIRRVIIANTDPHRRVNGRGIRLLEGAGLVVETGLLAQEAEELNPGFFTFHRRGRPYVHLKIAQSLDGGIAAGGGDARWITGESCRKIVHRLRASLDAVLVGRGTAQADDPELTVRLVRGRNPLRVVLDSRLLLSPAARLFQLPDRGKTLIVHSRAAPVGRAKKIQKSGAALVSIETSPEEKRCGLPLCKVLAALGERGVRSVLVEGGAEVFGSFLREGLWDKISVFIAPILLGKGRKCVEAPGAASVAGALHLKNVVIKKIGNYILMEGHNVYGNN
ncbi:MAG: bifunctional diaminohydroxyphosphoribosylaminopyrimidine deaminase/5-amino-6-(5-phosphoribosylamino)uracil reductase RibD [Spirochaetales bacterium]|jgi:diaminohydroxyphosphoribosylaminopyrimidine deaminase/5-amino-6-(5-phosphoribosylamino)uracil reductase|nr:bifunctional diaminohydroxyphosphoribosylaminopyrimidine deaminase/5-amino-6-(5-phosphoribosylamino)uracil reductase RibD [Spirochaetales bacterium]